MLDIKTMPTAPISPQPIQSPQPPLTKPQVTTSPTPPARGRLINYLLALVTLIIGVALGYFLFNNLPGKSTQAPAPTPQSLSITLPSDAVQIQACSDHRGTLYVKPADIPVGPVYMVNKGKVIGIEYMLAKDEFLGGKSFKDLLGLGMKMDHVNVGLLSQGHEGYTVPHYHVDIYNVPKAIEEAIVCPGGSTASSSAQTSPSASSSASASSSGQLR